MVGTHSGNAEQVIIYIKRSPGLEGCRAPSAGIKMISGKLFKMIPCRREPISPSKKGGRRLHTLGLRFNPRLWLTAFVIFLSVSPSPITGAKANVDAEVFLRVNQVGYHLTDAKIAIAVAAAPLAESFSVVDAITGEVVALTTQCLLYELMTGDSRYRAFASRERDWLLGRNPWGSSMFTEIPADGTYPRDVHLMANSILKRAVRGGLVDGPVYRKIFQSLKGVGITEPDPLAPFQDELAVYHDYIKDYSTNEPTMDGTASETLLWALPAPF